MLVMFDSNTSHEFKCFCFNEPTKLLMFHVKMGGLFNGQFDPRIGNSSTRHSECLGELTWIRALTGGKKATLAYGSLPSCVFGFGVKCTTPDVSCFLSKKKVKKCFFSIRPGLRDDGGSIIPC